MNADRGGRMDEQIGSVVITVRADGSVNVQSELSPDAVYAVLDAARSAVTAFTLQKIGMRQRRQPVFTKSGSGR
jgi:hypothetical protein